MLKIQGQIQQLKLTTAQFNIVNQRTRSKKVFSYQGTQTNPHQFNHYGNLLSVETQSFHFYIDDKIYNGSFSKIFFEENDQLVCIAENENIISILDLKRDLLYLPNGVTDTRKGQKRFMSYIFIGIIALFVPFFYFIHMEMLIENIIVILICISICYYLVWAGYNDFKPNAIYAERILNAYGFENVNSVHVSPHKYKTNHIFKYREIFDDQLYPENYFD